MKVKMIVVLAVLAFGATACPDPSPSADPTITRLTNGNLGSNAVALSADGKWAAILSTATDLTPEADLEPGPNAYVVEIATGDIERLTNITGFEEFSFSPNSIDISSDGNEVLVSLNADQVFGLDLSSAFNRVVVHDRALGTSAQPDTSDPLVLVSTAILSASGDGVYALATDALTPGASVLPAVLDWRTGEFETLNVPGDFTNAPEVVAASSDDNKVLVKTRSNPLGTGTDSPDLFVADVTTGSVTQVTSLDLATGFFASYFSANVNTSGDVAYLANITDGLGTFSQVSQFVSGTTGIATDLLPQNILPFALLNSGRVVGGQPDPLNPLAGKFVIYNVSNGATRVVDEQINDGSTPPAGYPLSPFASATPSGSAIAYVGPRQDDVPVDNNGNNPDVFVWQQ